MGSKLFRIEDFFIVAILTSTKDDCLWLYVTDGTEDRLGFIPTSASQRRSMELAAVASASSRARISAMVAEVPSPLIIPGMRDAFEFHSITGILLGFTGAPPAARNPVPDLP